MRTRMAVFVASLTGVSGCAAPAPQSSVEVSDSAGVVLVRYAEGLPLDLPTWTVAAEPDLAIGTTAVDQLFRVQSAHSLSDGSVAVLNAGSQEVLVFGPDGLRQAALGGEGEGPGEFTNLEAMYILPGDSVFALQRVPYRFAVFARDGTLARSGAPQRELVAPFIDFEPFGFVSSTRVAVYAYPDYFTTPFTDGPNRAPQAFGTMDLESGAVTQIGSMPSLELIVERTERGIRQSLLPFGRQSDAAASPFGIAIATGDGFVIEHRAVDGNLTHRITVDATTSAVTTTDVDRYVADLLDRFPVNQADRRQELENQIRAYPIPKVKPAIRRIEFDAVGNLWVEQFPEYDTPNTSFTVFDTDGLAVAHAELPRGLSRQAGAIADPWMEIGQTHVLGIWQDDLGIETVRRYRILGRQE